MTMIICTHCNDTHMVEDSRYEHEIMCQWCPSPCRECAMNGGRGAFCAETPCACNCHKPKETRPMDNDKIKYRVLEAVRSSPLFSATELGTVEARVVEALSQEPGELVRAYIELGDVREELEEARAEIKRLRNKAWWLTYRAALTGTSVGGGMHSPTYLHERAAQVADAAHGPLDAPK